MKLFGSRLFGQAIKAAGVGGALMLSVSVSHSQSGPFAGFNGSWSGNGTVALSDGKTERIRCKASYNVSSTGLGLKQTLRCASDSYKFDLSTDVTSQGNRISGNWSEASRNLFGNLQGTAGRRGFGICRQREVADHRQQADGADQLQGRDQGRQYHDVQGRLTPPLLPFTPPASRDLPSREAAATG